MEIEVDYRDNLSPGFKFNDWEKKGVPLRIEIGLKDIEKKQVVMVRRDTGEKKIILMSKLKKIIIDELLNIQENLFNRAKKFRETNSFSIDNYEKLIDILKGDGAYVYSHWCGDETCETKIKEVTKATIRCIALDQKEEEGQCIVCGKKSKKRVIFSKAY
jgi:prolyl-tRNA synthetase